MEPPDRDHGRECQSPFLRDQEAFMQVLDSDIPLIRMLGTSKPVLSGKEIADRVLERIKRETGEIRAGKRPRRVCSAAQIRQTS